MTVRKPVTTLLARQFSVSQIRAQASHMGEERGPKSVQDQFKDTFMKYVYINGGIAAVLVGGWLFYKGSSWMSGFSLSTFFKIGFTSGFVTAMGIVVIYSSILSMIQINKAHVLKYTMEVLRKEPKIIRRLGEPLVQDGFTATSYTGGLFGEIKGWKDITPKSLLSVPPRQIQLMFEITGPTGENALVSVAAQKTHIWSTAYRYKSIALDFDETNEKEIILGTADDCFIKGLQGRRL
uniref:Uncharacterized protein n=1 Tax=Eutreptiella gymnastica TaxID=73025 RepID=A0A7S1IMN6_9EUGL